MELRVDARIPFPREVVFAACRDDIVELKPYLPDIRSIEVTSRKEDGAVVDLAVDWRGGAEVPAPLRAVLGESVFSWTDYSSWDADLLSCDWWTQPHAFAESVRCRARDRFLEDGPGGTLLELRGELAVDGRKIRGVPAPFAASLGRAMEGFLVRKIQTSLAQTADALARHLEARRLSGNA